MSKRKSKKDDTAIHVTVDQPDGDTNDLPSTITADTTSAVSDYDRDPNRAEFYGFGRTNTVFSYDNDGNVISRKLLWPEEPAVATVKRKQFTLPFDVTGLAAHPLLPVGLVVISGPTGGGKSSLVRALAEVMDIRRLLAVEPHDTGEEVANLPTFSTVDGALVAAVSASYANPEALYAIDSLRAPLFETTGAAGSKGVIMPFFTQLTRVSNSLAMAGITVVATVNPMNEEPGYVEEFMSKLSASLPAVILLDRVSTDGARQEFSGTVQMRPDRKKMPFRFSSASPVEPSSIALSDIEFEPVAHRGQSSYDSIFVNAISKAN